MSLNFEPTFEALTGKKPFPWQTALYDDWFSQGKIPPAATLPTGLGKTSVIAIWLIALANKCNVPRRLVYVVNRRTVVDQTTEEVEKYKKAKVDGIADFALSTLRGQFADNREWSADPSRPAVICGTVDMIGSRLLFSGYGLGMGSKPLHAGFLGQDALLIHDEAHLEPAFQKLLETVVAEQTRCKEFGKFQVMELTATSRGVGKTFGLTPADYENDIVKERINAAKKLHLHPLTDAKKPQKELSDKALSFKDRGKAVLIFAYNVDAVLDVQAALEKAKQKNVRTLTGTMRGFERDQLVEDKTFARFLPDVPTDATQGTVYLVCTSAGEVGVNISADHLICDLSTFESMAQRLGRVNRFGMFPECEVHVYFPTEWDGKHALTVPRKKTLALLTPLNDQDVSPANLSLIPQAERLLAFAPTPTILPATDILFDAWALTTIKGKLPGRPPVEPYLHGLPTDWQPPETQVAWRQEVEWFSSDDFDDKTRTDVLEAFPLKPHETLKEPSYRAFEKLAALAKRHPEHHAWIVDDDNAVAVVELKFFLDKDNKEEIEGCTVLLDPHTGGLNKQGLFDTSSTTANDIADIVGLRERTRNDDAAPEGMHEVDRVELPAEEDEAEPGIWIYYAVKNTGEPTSKFPLTWRGHVDDVVKVLDKILGGLELDASLVTCLKLAAEHHDDGKVRKEFQTVLGNRAFPTLLLAKSGKQQRRKLDVKYRHEFGSLHDVKKSAAWSQLTSDEQELVLHLIAAHHGRARPHFPADEVFDPASTPVDDQTLAAEVPRRFGKLQRKYGRWGLVYLESLLRAADWAASDNPDPTGYVKGGAS